MQFDLRVRFAMGFELVLDASGVGLKLLWPKCTIIIYILPKVGDESFFGGHVRVCSQ